MGKCDPRETILGNYVNEGASVPSVRRRAYATAIIVDSFIGQEKGKPNANRITRLGVFFRKKNRIVTKI